MLWTECWNSDKKWVFFGTPWHRHYWLALYEPLQKQTKPKQHQQKIMFSFWWTARGIVYCELDRWSMQLYTRSTWNMFILKIVQVQWIALVNLRGAIHDNSRSNVAQVTCNTTIRLHWETLINPPYIPDIAPSGYHLFHSMDNNLQEWQFRTLEEVIQAMDDFLVRGPLSYTTVGSIICASVGDRSLLLMKTISGFPGMSYFMLSCLSL